MKLFAIATLCAATFAVSAAQAQMQNNTARVRVVHASPDAPAVDVWVDGTRVLEALPYKASSAYLSVPAGTRLLQVTPTGTNTIVLEGSYDLTQRRDYTVMAVGNAAGGANPLRYLLMNDDTLDARPRNAKLRVVHAAAGAPTVDAYLTTPYETLDGKTAAASNVPFKGVSPYYEVPAGPYQLRITLPGTRTVAIDSGAAFFGNEQVRTIVAIDKQGGGGPFEFLILRDNDK